MWKWRESLGCGFALGRFNEQGKCQAQESDSGAGQAWPPTGDSALTAGWRVCPAVGSTWWRNGLRLLFSRPGPRRLHPQTRPEVRLAAAFPWERESAFWRFVRGRPGTGVDLWVMITALVPEPESPNWARLLVLMSEWGPGLGQALLLALTLTRAFAFREPLLEFQNSVVGTWVSGWQVTSSHTDVYY